MIKTISGKFNSPAWIIYVQAFFAVWAIVLLGGLTTRNILTPVLYLALLCLFQYASSRRNSSPSIYDSRISVITPALSLIFSLFTLMAEHENMAAGLENPAFRIFILIAGGIGAAFSFLLFSPPGIYIPFGSYTEKRICTAAVFTSDFIFRMPAFVAPLFFI